jgi:hypothetical protein
MLWFPVPAGHRSGSPFAVPLLLLAGAVLVLVSAP